MLPKGRERAALSNQNPPKVNVTEIVKPAERSLGSRAAE